MNNIPPLLLLLIHKLLNPNFAKAQVIPGIIRSKFVDLKNILTSTKNYVSPFLFIKMTLLPLRYATQTIII